MMDFYRVRTKTIANKVYERFGVRIIATSKYSYTVSKDKGDRTYIYDITHGGRNERDFLIYLLEEMIDG